MDGQLFDALTKWLVTDGLSRRRLLRGMGGSLTGAALGGIGVRLASAAPGHHSVCVHRCIIDWPHGPLRDECMENCCPDEVSVCEPSKMFEGECRPNCICATDIDGDHVCAYRHTLICQSCARDKDCESLLGPGALCVHAPNCCPDGVATMCTGSC